MCTPSTQFGGVVELMFCHVEIIQEYESDALARKVVRSEPAPRIAKGCRNVIIELTVKTPSPSVISPPIRGHAAASADAAPSRVSMACAGELPSFVSSPPSPTWSRVQGNVTGIEGGDGGEGSEAGGTE
eukprot:2439356-Prymnesium_polylepis.3